MSTAMCSECGHIDKYFKLKVPGECKTHLYCSKCFKDIPTKETLFISNCAKCMEFYKAALISILSICNYCNKSLTYDSICSKHSVCGNCLQTWPIENAKNCFGCLQARYHVCNFCKNYSRMKTFKCPTHFAHRYCYKCYENFKNDHGKLSCELCKTAFKSTSQKNVCFICKEVSNAFYLKECDNYKLCIRCLNLISWKFFAKLYPEITKTADFLSHIKIGLNEKCLSCWRPFLKKHINIDFKLVMLSCKYQHVFCSTCFKMPKTKEMEISCEYCNEYFSPQNSTCYFCRKSRENSDIIECGHIICIYCLFFIKENNSVRYIKSINCLSCKNYLCHNYEIDKIILDEDENMINKFRNEKKNNSEGELIIYCDKGQNIIRKFTCIKCLNMIDNPNCKIKNIKCPYNHFYCSYCFEESLYKKGIDCQFCMTLYKLGADYNCIFCKDEFKTGHVQLCKNHNVCLICINNLSDYELELYTKVFGCSECIENFKSHKVIIRKNQNKSLQNQDSLESYTQNPKKKDENMLDNLCSLPNNKYKTINSSIDTDSFQKQEKGTSLYSIENFEESKNIPLVKSTRNINSSKPNSKKTDSLDKQCSVISIKNKQNPLETSINKIGGTMTNIIYSLPKNIVSTNKDDSNINTDCKSESRSNSIDKQQVDGKNKEESLENLYKLNTKPDKNLTFCCGKQVERMECSHPLCQKCIENAFENKFNYFIKLIIERNYDLLNSISWEIGCYKNECYLKVCFPYELVKNIALKIVQTRNYPEKLAYHFDLLFEGIKYNFHECQICKFVTGDKPGGTCMWCN